MTVEWGPTLETPDDDPYLWLEEIDGAEAIAWVDAQNARTLEKFGGPGFEADRVTLAAIYERPDNIPYVTRRGRFLYNMWKDATNPRGIWRRTTLENFRADAPQWHVILDLDQLATQENEDWIWGGASTMPQLHDRAIVRLSRGGRDAVVLREFDIEARRFVSEGFYLPEAKGGAVWLDKDALLLSSALGDGMATEAGYARTVRLWQRHSEIGQCPVLFEIGPKSMSAGAAVDRTQAPNVVWYTEQLNFFEYRYWLGDRTGPKTRLDLPMDIWAGVARGWLVVKRRTAWTIGARTYPPDTLLGISLAAFLAGDRDFRVLFEPAERRALQYFSWCDGRLILSILDELQPVFEVLTPNDRHWLKSALPGLPKIGAINIWPTDLEPAESNGDLFVNAQDPITPATLMLIETDKSPVVLKRAPQTFSADGLTITRHEAISVDGERIPYVQVGPAVKTGDAAVHLTAYGGFGISNLPYYNSAIGKLWLEHGGTSVTANIRGGGEFGTRWHDAGRRAGKRLTHDDFAAVAADLVNRGVTRPDRIAAEGGSNGGILISNMLVRYPERFGALFCTIPLIDMRRYCKLLAGASWIAEYGNPDVLDDWAFLQTYSAYHLAAPGHHYPPILLATTRRDDRVHPGHARKMAAKLQAIGYEAYFYEAAAGGHGYGKDNKERAAFTALGYRFLKTKIGWEVGND
jgi:prolyl oligopeptidase